MQVHQQDKVHITNGNIAEQFSVQQYIIMIHDDNDDDDWCNEYEIHDDVLSGKDFFLWQSKCEETRVKTP